MVHVCYVAEKYSLFPFHWTFESCRPILDEWLLPVHLPNPTEQHQEMETEIHYCHRRKGWRKKRLRAEIKEEWNEMVQVKDKENHF